MSNKVIIIGGLHHNTLGVIRSLGEKGFCKSDIHVVVVDKKPAKNNIVSTCKYVQRDNITYLEDDKMIPLWLEKNATEQNKPVLICCSDGSAEAVLSHAKQLARWYSTPSLTMDVSSLMEKEYQGEIAKKFGFRVPYSQVIDTSHCPEWPYYPCITKPIKSVLGGGKTDIRISNNEEELKANLRTTASDVVQIQQFIKKDIEYQLIGCSLNKGEQIIIPGYTEIIRQPNNTNTGYLVYRPIDNFEYDESAVCRFIQGIGYSGLFSLEFIRDKDGVDYYLEINMRNDGNAYCVTTAGVNLPFIWVQYNNGDDYSEESMRAACQVFFMPEFSDVLLGVKSVGPLNWLKQCFEAQSHAIASMRDIGPFFVTTRDCIALIFRKIKQKMHI